jgi:hypothetical protein
MEKKFGIIAPWKCLKCLSIVFVKFEIHAYLCHLYRNSPSLVISDNLAFASDKANDLQISICPRGGASKENFIDKLLKAYVNGYKQKLITAICPRCKWERGFFFMNGNLYFDPGCFCNGNTSFHQSPIKNLKAFIDNRPSWGTRCMADIDRFFTSAFYAGATLASDVRPEQKSASALADIDPIGQSPVREINARGDDIIDRGDGEAVGFPPIDNIGKGGTSPPFE